MRELNEDELLAAIQSCGRDLHGRIALTYESGPYDIERPTMVTDRLAHAIQRKFCEVNGIAFPHGVTPLQSENDPRMAFCPACFVEVTPEQAGAQINAARVLAEFAKTAPGRLPSHVQEALAVIDGVSVACREPSAPLPTDGSAAEIGKSMETK